MLTFSISPDYARVWHWFAQRYLPSWNKVIVDCAGTLQPERVPGASVVRFANLAHGKKIDVFLTNYLNAEIVFLCDDDKYIVADLTDAVHDVERPTTAAISLAPRDWYAIRIGEHTYRPMGSYALILKRSAFLQRKLSFKNVKRPFVTRVVPPRTKEPFGYDCADYANEQLLKEGMEIITDRYQNRVTGFDGLSAPRIFLMRYGKRFALDALRAAPHFKKGSLNGVMARTLYGVAQFEKLYRTIFREDPMFVSDLTTADLRAIIKDPDVIASYDATDRVLTNLRDHVTNLLQ